MEKRIYYHDTDAGGVVYYSNYLKYLEEARTEFLENKGLSVKMFTDRGLIYAVRKCTISYRSPAKYGDTIICEAGLKKITAAQLIFHQTIYEKGTGKLIAEAEIFLACLNREFKPTPIPEDLKKRLLK